MPAKKSQSSVTDASEESAAQQSPSEEAPTGDTPKGVVPQPDVPAKPTPEPPRRLDETTPGGRYIVNGKLVDANGKEIKEE